jgi:hypothetical protein
LTHPSAAPVARMYEKYAALSKLGAACGGAQERNPRAKIRCIAKPKSRK